MSEVNGALVHSFTPFILFVRLDSLDHEQSFQRITAENRAGDRSRECFGTIKSRAGWRICCHRRIEHMNKTRLMWTGAQEEPMRDGLNYSSVGIYLG